MPLVPAVCTQCGSPIQVDDSKEAGICPHCGTAFITEKVVNNYVTNHVSNTTVTQNIVVKLFGKQRWFCLLWKRILDKKVRRLNRKGVDDSPYRD